MLCKGRAVCLGRTRESLFLQPCWEEQLRCAWVIVWCGLSLHTWQAVWESRGGMNDRGLGHMCTGGLD